MDLTAKTVALIGSLEGLCLEAYKDSANVWTAFLGVTNASGHEVYPRYKDNPQTMGKALEVSIWLLRTKYLPSVLQAFPQGLTENQLAAAISFHWNTGKVLSAQWVKDFNSGNTQKSYEDVMQWTSGGVLTGRRSIERELFFKGTWPSLRVPVRPVMKPTYHPDWAHTRSMDLMAQIEAALKA